MGARTKRMDLFTTTVWAASLIDPIIDPALAAGIGLKAAADAEIAARYAFYSLLVQSLVPIAVAWLTYKQATLQRSMAHLEKNTNAIKDELVAAKLAEGLATGNLQGRAEQTAERANRLTKKV
jgi:hypothetical protein